jgi:hypothetical protein
MSVEFISGILTGAAATAHAERSLARTSAAPRGAAGSSPTAESVGQSLETGDRDGDGRQAWSIKGSDQAKVIEVAEFPAPAADGPTSGARLDLIA